MRSPTIGYAPYSSRNASTTSRNGYPDSMVSSPTHRATICHGITAKRSFSIAPYLYIPVSFIAAHRPKSPIIPTLWSFQRNIPITPNGATAPDVFMATPIGGITISTEQISCQNFIIAHQNDVTILSLKSRQFILKTIILLNNLKYR